MPPPQALAIAKQKGLDLVEISPTACRRSAGSWTSGSTSTRSRSARARRKKHQKVIEVKEIKFRPKVDEHDYQFKKKHIERFLEDGDKVKATIFFRGREMAHPEIGRRILERLVEELAEVAIAESMPRLEGNQMHTILSREAAGRRPAPKQPRPAQIDAATRATEDRAKSEEDAETEDTPGRRQALQEDQERKVPARQGLQAPHPDQQDDEAEARTARHDDGGGRRRAEARADASV